MLDGKHPSSFRDPSGFLFFRGGAVYRVINNVYKENYDPLMGSGLYEALTREGLLIPHAEADPAEAPSDTAYKVIKPVPLSFITYPYEWSFSQLKDAALATLRVQQTAFRFGMSLKDCSAYNIQFLKGSPVFIDTLSFEKYPEGRPWVAYRQFCQHFLAPLALMKHTDVRLSQLFRVYVDGVPLDLASALLPFRTRLRFSLLSHIHLHAGAQRRYAGKGGRSSFVRSALRAVPAKELRPPFPLKMGRLAFLGLIDNLESTVKRLRWQPKGTEWADYYEDTNYSAEALAHKKRLVAEFLARTAPKTVWDLGANVGLFSRIASDQGIETIAFDVDPAAVEKNYLTVTANRETCLLPLVLDLTNPSPGLGWANTERTSFLDRGPADTVLALALVHHLAISNNVPLGNLAEFLAKIGRWLIIEFVPKSDSQVQRLLASREDVFTDYTQAVFERDFAKFFAIRASTRISRSERTLYLLERAVPCR
jgi:hypothetical protein